MCGDECCGEVLVRHVAGRDDDVRRSGAGKFFGDNGEPLGITRVMVSPYPCEAKRVAMPSPIPLEAPVTSADRVIRISLAVR